MSETVLITYATRYGSTKEVAERIAELIKNNDVEIQVLQCSTVKSLESFSFILIGAPFYIGKMLKEAKEFITRFQPDLENKKVAFFALGPLSDIEKEVVDAQDQMTEELNQFPWLKFVSTQMFAAKYDPKNLRFADKILTLLPASPLYQRSAVDCRDWEKISSWANCLPLS